MRRNAFTPGLLGILAMITGATLATAGGASALVWSSWEDLPDAMGRKGMYGGVSNGHVLLLGGSNFPVPAREGGKKAFYRDAFVCPLPLARERPWQLVPGALPAALGEGAAVTTPHGIACVGGHDGRGPIADGWLLRWNADRQAVERHGLPDLPHAVANGSTVLHDGWLYVAGGEGAAGALRMFCRLELGRAATEPGRGSWEMLPGWPGAGRFGCILNVVTTPAGPRLLLAGGLPGPAKGRGDYLREAMLFSPVTRQWEPAADMPRGAVLGASVRGAATQVLVLGGSDGHDFARMRELGERYRIPNTVLMYDAEADRWTERETMPIGTVGSALIELGGGGWLIAGGEYSPGLRTPRVFHLHVPPEKGAAQR